MKIRTAILASWELGFFMHRLKGPEKKAKELGTLCRYAISLKRSSRKAIPMNVDDVAKKWVAAIVQMCTSHDKDDYDAADNQSDELMGPILTAPIKQIREFYDKVRTMLKEDKRIPFVVWIGFEAWGEAIIKDAPDEDIKKLKNKLAKEISDLVEMDIKEQLPEAIKRALRWRDPEQLEQIKEELEKGKKPRLQGKESCLFLVIGKGKKAKKIMI
jgi:type III secretion system FlhB-like substrate exporter